MRTFNFIASSMFLDIISIVKLQFNVTWAINECDTLIIKHAYLKWPKKIKIKIKNNKHESFDYHSLT